MKKIVILAGLFMFIGGALSVLASEYTKFSSSFVKHFKDCDSYEETINSEYEGQKFTTERKIIGWRNGYCKYVEQVSSDTDTYRLNCMFSDMHVDELYKSMKDKSKTPEEYSLDMFTLQKDPKTGQERYVPTSKTIIKGNKAFITWAKYQNNPYFCEVQKLK